VVEGCADAVVGEQAAEDAGTAGVTVYRGTSLTSELIGAFGYRVAHDFDYGLLLFTRHDYDVDLDPAFILGRAREVWRCRACGRLRVFWDHLGDPTEYLPADLASLEFGGGNVGRGESAGS
jgi:hypothetical protein